METEGTADEQSEATGRSVTRLTDPRALRAYAHPVRLKLVALLRTEGPLTATRAGELLGESSGTCSFHLRQLAKYGLVGSALAERYFEHVLRWLDAVPGEPPEWQEAAQFGDWLVYLTADELAALGRQVKALLDPYLDRTVSPGLRPPESRLVTYLHLAFPGELVNKDAAGAG